MIDAIVGRDRPQPERVYTFEAADVVAIFLWIGAPLMVCVDTADTTEIVLRGAGIELIEPQDLVTPEHPEAGQSNRGDDGSFSAADRAVATAWIDDALRQIELQHHCPAVTG